MLDIRSIVEINLIYFGLLCIKSVVNNSNNNNNNDNNKRHNKISNMAFGVERKELASMLELSQTLMQLGEICLVEKVTNMNVQTRNLSRDRHYKNKDNEKYNIRFFSYGIKRLRSVENYQIV